MRVPGKYLGAVTALNFWGEDVQQPIDLAGTGVLAPDQGGMVRGANVVDAVTGQRLGQVPASGRLVVDLPPLGARTLIVERP
jgi:hypothetical protein